MKISERPLAPAVISAGSLLLLQKQLTVIMKQRRSGLSCVFAVCLFSNLISFDLENLEHLLCLAKKPDLGTWDNLWTHYFRSCSTQRT